MTIQSAYVVNTQVVNVDDRPVTPPSILDPHWEPLFCSKTCFNDLSHIVWPESNVVGKFTPNVQNVSQLYFSPKEFRIRPEGYTDDELKDCLCNLNGNKSDDKKNRSCESLLYFCPYILDNRVSSFFFILKDPVELKSTHIPNESRDISELRASGKIYAHFYPCGYVVVHVPITLSWEGHLQIPQIRDLATKVHPGKESNWIWASNLHNGSLDTIMKEFIHEFNRSAYSKGANLSDFLNWNWFTSLTVRANVKANKFAKSYFKLNLNQLKHLPLSDGSYLLGADKDISLVYPSNRNHGKAYKFVWDLLLLVELSLLKRQIYKDYERYLVTETNHLKTRNLSLYEQIFKLRKKDIAKWTFDEPSVREVSSFLDYQDNVLKEDVQSTHKIINEWLNDHYNIVNRSKDFKQHIEEWEAEVRVSPPELLQKVRLVTNFIGTVTSLASLGK